MFDEMDEQAQLVFFVNRSGGDKLAALIGRAVDVRTPHDLSQYFRDDVLRSAVEQYAA